jgi:phage-related protein
MVFKDLITGISVILTTIWNGLVDLGKGIIELDADIVNGIKGIVAFFVQLDKDILGGLKDVWNILSAAWGWLTNTFWGAVGVIRDVVNGVWDVLKTVWGWFNSAMGPVFSAMKQGIDFIYNILQTVANALGNINPSNWANAIGLATGGAVVQQGLAFIHAGETVLPRGAVGIAGGIRPATVASQGSQGGDTNISVTVTGNSISSAMDLNEIAQKVAKAIQDNRRRLGTW